MNHFLLRQLYMLCKLRSHQRLRPAALDKIQFVKFKRIVSHVYHEVGYYKKLFKRAGLLPSMIRKKEDIRKLPITTREIFRNVSVEERISKSCKDYIHKVHITSGSTGKPIEVFISKYEEALMGLSHLRMLFANGYTRKDTLAVLTHPQFIDANKQKDILQLLGFFKREYISIFLDKKKQLKRLIDIKPTIIKGYTSVIKAIALEIASCNIKNIRPRLVFCTAEYLSDNDRALISDIFGSEVIDYYSSAECGLIAWECSAHIGYHVNYDNVIVELIHNNREAMPGEEAEVVITNLNRYVMPFIRYKIGDIVLSNNISCSCNSNFPLMNKIRNREVNKRNIDEY